MLRFSEIQSTRHIEILKSVHFFQTAKFLMIDPARYSNKIQRHINQLECNYFEVDYIKTVGIEQIKIYQH